CLSPRNPRPWHGEGSERSVRFGDRCPVRQLLGGRLKRLAHLSLLTIHVDPAGKQFAASGAANLDVAHAAVCRAIFPAADRSGEAERADRFIVAGVRRGHVSSPGVKCPAWLTHPRRMTTVSSVGALLSIQKPANFRIFSGLTETVGGDR